MPELTKQQRYQAKHRAAGLCIFCKRKARADKATGKTEARCNIHRRKEKESRHAFKEGV